MEWQGQRIAQYRKNRPTWATAAGSLPYLKFSTVFIDTKVIADTYDEVQHNRNRFRTQILQSRTYLLCASFVTQTRNISLMAVWTAFHFLQLQIFAFVKSLLFIQHFRSDHSPVICNMTELLFKCQNLSFTRKSVINIRDVGSEVFSHRIGIGSRPACKLPFLAFTLWSVTTTK
jgi:hypothetical protein